MSHTYCVYTLANRSRTLYTGVTNNLERRMLVKLIPEILNSQNRLAQ